METKRKFITLQKSALPLVSPPESNKANQPRRGSHTIHLLSTRTLRSLRSTTTSTINGIYNSMSSANSQSTSNFSISSSLASIHRSNKKSYKISESVSNIQKAGEDANGTGMKYSDDEDVNSRDDIEFEDDEETEMASKMLDDNDYLDINNENGLAVNLFPSASKKKMLTSQSIKNLKKKKFSQFLISKSSIKRYHDDTNIYVNEDELFVNGVSNLKKHADKDSMEFEQLKYDSIEKLPAVVSQSIALSNSTNLMSNKKLDTL